MFSQLWLRGVTHPAVVRLYALEALARRYLRDRRSLVRRGRLNRTAFYERAWREAASGLRAEVRVVCDGILEIVRGDARARVSHNYTTLDDPVTLKVAGNKPAVYRLLHERGIPTPRFTEFSLPTIERAADFLHRSNRPCVVKPASGTGAGQGITTGITRRSQLVRAAAVAAAYGAKLLIERQVDGDNYRLLYLDGRLLDVVRRCPPTVTGDGMQTVRQLVRQANARRLRGGWQAAQGPISCDDDMTRTLDRQGLSLRSVPQPGRRVAVKTVINDNAADETEPVTGLFGRDTIAAGAAAAAAVGVRLAGVDVITPDPARPLAEVRGVILEVNTTPGLYHHKRGDLCPVARTILEAMLDEIPTGRGAVAQVS